jgi:hypothetical protein
MMSGGWDDNLGRRHHALTSNHLKRFRGIGCFLRFRAQRSIDQRLSRRWFDVNATRRKGDRIMLATMGRIVRYTITGNHPSAGRVVPAMITQVYVPGSENATVELCALDPTPFGVSSVPFSDEPKRGHWHWPELNGETPEVTFVAADEPAPIAEPVIAEPTVAEPASPSEPEMPVDPNAVAPADADTIVSNSEIDAENPPLAAADIVPAGPDLAAGDTNSAGESAVE